MVDFCACAALERWWKENPEQEPGNCDNSLARTCTTINLGMKEQSIGCLAIISVLNVVAAAMATGKDAVQHFGLPSAVLAHAAPATPDRPPPGVVPVSLCSSGWFEWPVFTRVGHEQGFRQLAVSKPQKSVAPMMVSTGLVTQLFVKFSGFGNAPSICVLGFLGIFSACTSCWSCNYGEPSEVSEHLMPTLEQSCHVKNLDATL